MIPDTAAAIAAHKRLAVLLPRRLFVMPGSGADADDDEPAKAPIKPFTQLARSEVGFHRGQRLRVISGRLKGEVVEFWKLDEFMADGSRRLRVRRRAGGASVSVKDVVVA